jgi:hypothetical protein
LHKGCTDHWIVKTGLKTLALLSENAPENMFGFVEKNPENAFSPKIGQSKHFLFIHFLIDCPQYNSLRQEFFMFISENNKNFAALSSENKFIWLLSNEDPVICQKLESSAKNWPCFFINALKLDLTVINKEPEWSVITHCQCNLI